MVIFAVCGLGTDFAIFSSPFFLSKFSELVFPIFSRGEILRNPKNISQPFSFQCTWKKQIRVKNGKFSQ